MLDALEAAKAAGAVPEFVVPAVAGIVVGDGSHRSAPAEGEWRPSMLSDLVAVLAYAEGAAMVVREATAKEFINDAFAHARFIAYVGAAKPLLEEAGVIPGEGLIALKDPQDASAFLQACAPPGSAKRRSSRLNRP